MISIVDWSKLEEIVSTQDPNTQPDPNTDCYVNMYFEYSEHYGKYLSSFLCHFFNVLLVDKKSIVFYVLYLNCNFIFIFCRVSRFW
jgi:hypothetical protein